MSKLLDRVEATLAKSMPTSGGKKELLWVSEETAADDRFAWEVALPKLLAVARAAEAQIGHALADDDCYTPEFNALIRAVKALDAKEAE